MAATVREDCVSSLELARWQFGITTVYHFLFVPVTIGLALPFVLLYQAWTYWVFRHRVGADDIGELRTPLDLLDARGRDSSGGEPAGSG